MQKGKHDSLRYRISKTRTSYKEAKEKIRVYIEVS